MNASTRRTVIHDREFQLSDRGYLLENDSWQDEIHKRADAMAAWAAPVFEQGQEGFVEGSEADFTPILPDPKVAYEEAIELAKRDAEAVADRLLQEARARAEAEALQIKTDAQKEIERLKTEADIQIRDARESAQKLGEQQGRSQGLEIGKIEGLAAGRADGLKEYEAKIRTWDALFRSASEQRHQAIADQEALLIDLVGEALHKCLQREAQERPTMVVDLAAAVLQRAHDRVKLRIHLNPEDVDRVHAAKNQLQLSVGAGELELIPDGRIEKGGCLLETEAGSMDARLGTMVSQAQEALKSDM